MCRARAGAKGQKVHKLSANESPLGASPAAMDAYRGAAEFSNSIPTVRRIELREAIASALRAQGGRTSSAARARTSCCSSSPMPILVRAMKRSIRNIGFLVYPIAIACQRREGGGGAGERSHRRCRCMLACVTREDAHRLPRQSQQSDRHLYSGARGEAPACGSAAEIAFSCSTRPMPNMSGATTMNRASSSSRPFDNVVMTRTFSKIHGLASLRLGWAYCPAHIADVLNRIRGPFNVGTPALAAGAAAIADKAHVERAIAHNDQWLAWLTQRARRARPQGDAERRQFPAGAFPATTRAQCARRPMHS